MLWVVIGHPAGHAARTLALLVVGATAMGFHAAIALAFHLPNVATVAMTATLAQLGAREGNAIVGSTPAVSLVIPLCLAYLMSAVVAAAVPETAMAFGPVLLLFSAVAIEALIARRGGPAGGLAAARGHS